MLNSTVELITLWASSSPSLLAFGFCHIIIAVLFVGGRGEWKSGAAAEAETLDGVQLQGGKRSGGGQESPTAAGSVVELEHRQSCAPDVKGCFAGADTDAVQLEAGDKSSGTEDGPAPAAAKVQEKCGNDEEEDELLMRAEEFIQRMNRVWRAENVRLR